MIESLGQAGILGRALADVSASRESARLRRIRRIVLFLAPAAVWLWVRWMTGDPVSPGLPQLPANADLWLPGAILVCVVAVGMIVPLLTAGRSPHVEYRSSEIDISLDDVRGAGVVKDEVVRTLNLFLAYKTFRDEMGGTPRRAILFEGPPGTGKTYMAKAMAREAGVPFLFVSSSAFQSHYYGMTARKLRSYFKALRRAARKEGGAIGFIEELDAIGGARSGMGNDTGAAAGVVNELLIQLQSFDEPTRGIRFKGWWIDQINRFLPSHQQLRKPRSAAANVLVVGATNRAADLDPALVRPGRFDRSIHVGLPSRKDRMDIIDYYLSKKSHTSELDDPAKRETLGAMTAGYSPVMIEHLFDEALVWALRRGANALDWHDLQQAKMTEEIGLKQPVEYTIEERQRIATHEAGHATIAWLVGKDRKLEVLSIVKRKDALGLLAHSDLEERFTKTRSEIVALIQIAMGGMAAEEQYFGEAGTGPSGDLQAATTAACQMVGSLGMGSSLISYEAAAVSGAGNIVAKVLANEHSRKMVEQILDDAKATAEGLLHDHANVLEALRDALLEREELIGEEILEVIRVANGDVLDVRSSERRQLVAQPDSVTS